MSPWQAILAAARPQFANGGTSVIVWRDPVHMFLIRRSLRSRTAQRGRDCAGARLESDARIAAAS